MIAIPVVVPVALVWHLTRPSAEAAAFLEDLRIEELASRLGDGATCRKPYASDFILWQECSVRSRDADDAMVNRLLTVAPQMASWKEFWRRGAGVPVRPGQALVKLSVARPNPRPTGHSAELVLSYEGPGFYQLSVNL
jgi:hypothetical protein